MGVVILPSRALTSAFVASNPIMITAQTLELNFDLVVASGPATVNWYLEFSETINSSDFYRESAQEDVGDGVVNIPLVVRTFALNGGGGLSAGAYKLNAQLVRQSKFARVQIQASVGTVTCKITAPEGILPQAPA